jgi:maltose alpha-D-glucosyltransferase/alpha-amylase
LQWLRRLIRVRKKYPVFGRGTLKFVPCENRRVVAYLREYQNQVVLVVNNLSAFAQAAGLDLQHLEGKIPVEMLGNHAFPPITKQPYFLSLGPHSFYWFRIEESPRQVPGAVGISE